MGKYALIKWKDGYQEVAALDGESKGILRYYVVERIEKSGRLAIDSTAQYPGLKIIGRKPDQIESITLTEDGSAKVFTLTPKEDKAEGGRIDHHYAVKEMDNKVMDELVIKVKKLVREMGITPKTAKEGDLEKIRKAIKLSAFEKQTEALSFVKMLLEKGTI